MKQLLVVEDGRLAQSLADFLASRGIPCELTESELGISVWLVDDSRTTEAEQEVKRFIKEPYHPRYAEAAWNSERPQTRVDYAAGQHQLLAELLLQAGPVTLLVALACVAVFLLSYIGLPMFALLGFHTSVEQLTSWQIWRFLTPTLLHFSVLHLVFNLMWWWYLGGRIEHRLGSGKLLVLFLVTGCVPNLLQAVLVGPDFGGLSGVAYGLLAYLWILPRRQGWAEQPVSNGLLGFMLLWLVLGFFHLFGPSMANMAHLGGLAIGLLQGWLDSRKPLPPR